MPKTLTKVGLVAEVAHRVALPVHEVDAVVEATLGVIRENLANGQRVMLYGFGSFQVINRPERPGVNPRTLEPIRVPASRIVRFRGGTALRDAIARPVMSEE